MGLQSELNEIESAMTRTLTELQDAVMNSRLVPLGSVFGRLRRTVRDVASRNGKQICFQSTGGETELDKKVIDQIADPLLHLVRNSVDHGIESSAERAACGKPAEGVVSLGVRQEGDRVVIEVRDDGRGLDRDRILRKAVERGIMSPEKAIAMTDPEIHALICAPGFSTAGEVTDVSGRGVGMDVVNQAVADLKGTLQIESRQGAGSVFRIKLPLTMAIMDALLVAVGGETYAVAVGSVKEIVELTDGAIHSAGGREFFQGSERVVPVVRLGAALGVTEFGSRESQTTVVVDSGEGQVGLTVDHVIGQREIVVKSLSRRFEHVAEISGGSVLGDGSVCLILDVPSLVARFAQDVPETAEVLA
jgi:two-component system chemotaxis sensor kinase CheA